MAQALVPLKDLAEAKTRLAGLLRPAERRALAQAMVEDVLAVLSGHPELSRVTLVSDDPCAGLLAAKYNIDCWSEQSLGCRGLNAVVQSAAERLLASSAEPLLVLHADLPLLAAADVSSILRCQRALQGLVVGCDQRGSGTNLLAFDPSCIPHFCFGVDSCSRHLAAAREAGFAVQVVRRSGIANDVDEAGDIAALMTSLMDRGEGETAALLCGTGLGARVTLTLATLPGGEDISECGKVNRK